MQRAGDKIQITEIFEYCAAVKFWANLREILDKTGS